jgi:hypothetical protein
MSRDVFLESFTLVEDIEVEMIFDLQKNILKLIKTRELFVIEANVPFMVD